MYFAMNDAIDTGTTIQSTISEGAEAYGAPRSAVLVDDDPLVHLTWKMYAKMTGVVFAAYKTPEEFMEAGVSRDCEVYVDSDLGGDLKGEEFARMLFSVGYRNITLATGHSPDSFPAMPWIKNIIGKDPPWA
jgi:hypothetical protein